MIHGISLISNCIRGENTRSANVMDDPTTKGIFEILVTAYGPPGLIIAVLGWWIMKQQERINKLTDDIVNISTATARSQAENAAAQNRLADFIRTPNREA